MIYQPKLYDTVLHLKDGRIIIQQNRVKGPAFQFGCVILYNDDPEPTFGEYKDVTFYPLENVLQVNCKEVNCAEDPK